MVSPKGLLGGSRTVIAPDGVPITYCTACKTWKPVTNFSMVKSGRARKGTPRTVCQQCFVDGYWQQPTDPDRSLRIRSRKYGITIERFRAMQAEQSGTCANRACPADITVDRQAYIDHDHACCVGRYSCGTCVRGLLCISCNSAVGLARDDRKILQGLITYLGR